MVLIGIPFSVCTLSITLNADESSTDKVSFSMGPSSVPSNLNEIQKANEKTLNPLLSRQTLDEYGLSLAADYNVLYQHLKETKENQNSAGGVFRFYGTWKPNNKDLSDDGKVVFMIENRHRLGTDLSPQMLLPSISVSSISGPTFSDHGTLLTNLYWNQGIDNRRLAFIAGIIDVTDYVDVFAMVNPWTDFNNLAFSTNPTIPTPNQGLGTAIQWRVTTNYYIIAGIADANADPHNPADAFKSFFSDAEYFKHIEFGWIESYENRFSDNIHVTLWEVDAREKIDIDNGKGIALSWSRQFGSWKPFARAGYSDGGGALVDRTISIGSGYEIKDSEDFVGFGANWGRPDTTLTDNNIVNQYIFETYYRWQAMGHLQIVPDVQYIINPAYDPNKNSEWLFALRMRITF